MSTDKNEKSVVAGMGVNSSAVVTGVQSSKSQDSEKIIYKSDVMKQLLNMIERVAPTDATVLISGESGTGKKLLAKTVHHFSHRKNKPFLTINCSSLREGLVESELFGHEKGAFTGAYSTKIGLAEMANGGTLFLDEIGELSLSIQAKLLRFLQEGEIYRVGGKEAIKVDIRLISATNKEIEKEVEVGNFREDLFYRVNTILLHAPPLRRRKKDISLLLNYFLEKVAAKQISSVKQFASDSIEKLQAYHWPGNIRELQNVCERLQVLTSDAEIKVEDLPKEILDPQEEVGSGDYDPEVNLHEMEKRYIVKALYHFSGNKAKAAKHLGITIKTLYNKLHEYNLFERFAVHQKRNSF